MSLDGKRIEVTIVFGFLAGDGERLESMKVVRGGKRSGRGEEEIG